MDAYGDSTLLFFQPAKGKSRDKNNTVVSCLWIWVTACSFWVVFFPCSMISMFSWVCLQGISVGDKGFTVLGHEMNLGSVEKLLWVSVITLMIIWTGHHGFEESCAVKELLSVKLLPVWLMSDDIDFAVFSQDLPPAIRPGSHVWWVCWSILALHNTVWLCVLPSSQFWHAKHTHMQKNAPSCIWSRTSSHRNTLTYWPCFPVDLLWSWDLCHKPVSV